MEEGESNSAQDMQVETPKGPTNQAALATL